MLRQNLLAQRKQKDQRKVVSAGVLDRVPLRNDAPPTCRWRESTSPPDRFAFDSLEQFKVQKVTFARPTTEQKKAGLKWDKTKIIHNSHLTISRIPLEAHEYVVNGKPAIEWIIEHYQVTRDKASGIVNDPNDWCRKHDQPRYIVDLIARVVRVSMETMSLSRREREDPGGRKRHWTLLRPTVNIEPLTPTSRLCLWCPGHGEYNDFTGRCKPAGLLLPPNLRVLHRPK